MRSVCGSQHFGHGVRIDRAVYVTFTSLLEIQRAMAEAGLGDVETAIGRVDALLELHAQRGPITLGLLHEARRSLALQTGDHVAAQQHLESIKNQYRSTANPALVALCDRIAADAINATVVPADPSWRPSCNRR